MCVELGEWVRKIYPPATLRLCRPEWPQTSRSAYLWLSSAGIRDMNCHIQCHRELSHKVVWRRVETWGWGYTSVVEHLASICEALGSNPSTPPQKKKGKERNGMNQTKISKIPGVQRVHSNQAKLELIVLSGNEMEGTRRAIRARSWRVCIFWEAVSFQNPGKALDTEKGGEMWILKIYLALMSSIQNIEGIRKKKKVHPSNRSVRTLQPHVLGQTLEIQQ